MPGKLISQLKSTGNPIIEQDQATLVWKGKHAPHLHGDFTGWETNHPVEMQLSSPGVWMHQLTLPADAYIEYQFADGDEAVPDPYNTHLTSNGIGGYNYYFSMPGYQPSMFVKKRNNVPHGIVSHHDLPTDYLIPGKSRVVHLYQPPTENPVPLVVVWDGQDYLRRGHLDTIVDNLICEKRIQPIALAFIDNAGQRYRAVEYSPSEAVIIFMLNYVFPLVKEELNLVDVKTQPGAYGVVGASLGGLMAFFTGLHLPGIFGHVLSQSGAFSWAGTDTVVFDLIEQGDVKPIKIWMDVGTYDLAGLLDGNRRMKEILARRGYKTEYREYHAGHNYPAWRDDISHGLEALFSE